MKIIFENQGEIDPRSITTFGVSAKENENPIGFYGTGLKYAIAIILRAGGKLRIYSGMEVFDFEKKAGTIRGKEFEFVYMNDAPLGFTTELGKTWKMWQCYRELYCNMLDEGGTSYEHAGDVAIRGPGWTKIVVECQEFTNVHRTRNTFIFEPKDRTPIVTTDRVDVYAGHSDTIFLRGMAVYRDGDKKFRNTYNFKQGVTLSEDRIMNNTWCLPMYLRDVIRLLPTPLMRECLFEDTSFHENDTSWTGVTIEPGSKLFEVTQEMHRRASGKMNATLREAFYKSKPRDESFAKLELSDVQKQMLEKAKTAASSIGLDPNEYPIVLVQSLGAGELGEAKNSKVYLAEECFNLGTKILAGTLIEELIHLRTDFNDCTRSMQNYLINQIVSLIEELNGAPL